MKLALTRTDKALLTLLRSGLWNSPPDSPELFPLGSDEWQEVFEKSRIHTVSAIVADSLEHLPENQLPPDRILASWAVESDRIERLNGTMTNVTARLSEMYRNLSPVCFKGQECASLYARPYSRECGDIDLYFNDIEASEAVARQHGYVPEHKPDGSFTYAVQGIVVEHHQSYIDLCAPRKRKWLRTLDANPGFETGGGGMLRPTPSLNLLVLHSHVMKHAFGRGVGLRQICDLARAYYSYDGMYDADELRDMYRKAGLTSWTRMVHAFLTDYLGLGKEFLPYAEPHADASGFLRRVMLSGNFGRSMPGNGQGKCRTLKAFMANALFAARYAPDEYFWQIAQLAGGQL